MLSAASPPVDGSSVSFCGGSNQTSSPNSNSASSVLAPLSAAAYLEMASRALGSGPVNNLSNNLPNPMSQPLTDIPPTHQYASALAAAAFQERQQQLFSAMCGAVLNPANSMNAPPNPALAAVLSNPAAAAALMAPHLMAACFREEPKPPHSYIGLIAMAILSSPEKKMVLSDIYQWILDHYPYFRTRGPGWRNSIRHNLSLNDCFVKVGRSANGKGHYWAIHPANLSDFQRGDFRRKKAQKRIKKHMGLIDNDEEDDDELNEEQHQQAVSDDDDVPNKIKSSLTMSPAERLSEFLLMKNGGGGSVLEELDPVAMATRLAMRLSAVSAGGNNLPPGLQLHGFPTGASKSVTINSNNNNSASSSQASSSSPVEVVIDDDAASSSNNRHHRMLNPASCSPTSVGDSEHIATKKRRIFDIDSLLAPSS